MASLTLRVLTRSGDTTKNAPLTNAEIDQNFINIDAELATLAPLASPLLTGSVGINMTPTYTLDVTGNGRLAGSFAINTTPSSNMSFRIGQGADFTIGTDYAIAITGVGYTGGLALNADSMQIGHNSAVRDLTFHAGTSFAERVRIDGATGGVGINWTGAPAAKLHVNDTSGIIAHFGEGLAGAGVSINNRLTAIPTTGTNANIAWLDTPFAAGTLLVGSRPGVGHIVLSATGNQDVVINATTGAMTASLAASNLTGTVSGDRGVTAGSATSSFVEYNGTTKTAGQFDGGTTAPTNTTRLNYDGYLYATRFYGDGSQLTSVAASTVANGVYTTGDQTIGGIKTFSSGIVGSISGNAGTVTNGVYTTGNQTIGGDKTFSGATTFSGSPSFTSVNGSYTGNFFLGNRWIRKATTGHAIEFVNNANTIVTHTFADGGDFTATGNVTAYSDETLKENWETLSSNFVYDLANVKNGTYDRIDTNVRQVGVSAQSLQKVMPEAVMEDSSGILSVAYGNAALAAAVKLAEKIVELESRIKEMESK